MENKHLLEALDRLGYPMLKVTDKLKAHETLAKVVMSDNHRYLEGFPVLLANMAKEEMFNYAKADGYLKSKTDKQRFKELFLLSLALYRLHGLRFAWETMYPENELEPNEKERVKQLKNYLLKDEKVKVADQVFDSERLKKTFEQYFTSEAQEVKNFGSKQEQFSLEFALSQMFSPKQKELFLKKLKGEVLTKTEREYFSRTVKKKAAALANSELHHLAQRVFQN